MPKVNISPKTTGDPHNPTPETTLRAVEVNKIVDAINANYDLLGASFDSTKLTDGDTLPVHNTPAWLFAGIGTFTKPEGGTIVTTNPVNVIATDGTAYSLLLTTPVVLTGYATLDDLAAAAADPITVNRTTFIVPKKNLFRTDDPDVTVDKIINYLNGGFLTNTSYYASGYMAVVAGQPYTLSFKTHFAWYNASKVFISGETSTGVANYTVTAPIGAAYFRSSVPKSKYPNWQFEAGTEATAIEPFAYVFSPAVGPFDVSSSLPAIIDNLNSKSATNPLSAGQGKILNDTINNYPWQPYAGTNTTNELLIKSSIKNIYLQGPGIVPTKTYYLARMVYKLTAAGGVNDIYFRIQDQDANIVAFGQFNSSSADVGVKEYLLPWNGNTAKLVIDWTNIPANFNYSTGNNTTMQLAPLSYIFSDKYIGAKLTNVADGVAAGDAANMGQLAAVSLPIQLKQSQNSVKRVGNILYIGSKWDDSNDILIKFSLSMANSLMTFSNVGLAANATKVPLINCDRPTTTTLATTSSDNIGPLQIDGVFVGANHLQEPSNIPTAKSNGFSFFADGFEVLDGDNFFASEVTVNAINEIYNPNTLSVSVKDVNVIEKVTYKVKGANIDVVLKHEFPISANITTYYGMQSVGQTFQEKVYFSHSAITDVTPRVANIQSGARPTYPNVEKIVLCNTDKSICQSMLMDKSCGLGLDTGTNVGSTDSLAFTTSTKTYFRLISAKTMAAGSHYFWRGTYTWFKQSTVNANTIFGFTAKRGKDTLLIADFKGAVASELIPVPDKLKLNDVTIITTDGGIVPEKLLQYDGAVIAAANAGVLTAKIS